MKVTDDTGMTAETAIVENHRDHEVDDRRK
jgi:hypothetical protein